MFSVSSLISVSNDCKIRDISDKGIKRLHVFSLNGQSNGQAFSVTGLHVNTLYDTQYDCFVLIVNSLLSAIMHTQCNVYTGGIFSRCYRYTVDVALSLSTYLYLSM